MSTQNDTAKAFKALHKPGSPIVLANAWDAITAQTIAAIPETKAIATASYAIAVAAGLEDPELTLEVNLRAAEAVAKVAKAAKKPLTVDFQDGYGGQLEDGMRRLVKLGAVGINLEDFEREKDGLYPVEVAVDRIKKALKVAADEGVPDFVINARTDALLTGLSIDDAIARSKAYLDAGATTAFIWGGRARGGTKTEEVQKAAKELGGRLNVSMVRTKSGGLGLKELSEIGVARISVGPQLLMKSLEVVETEAKALYAGKAV